MKIENFHYFLIINVIDTSSLISFQSKRYRNSRSNIFNRILLENK